MSPTVPSVPVACARLATLLAIAMLAACSTVRTVEVAPPPPPPPAPEEPLATSVHRHVYDPAQGDLIGRVQVTTAVHADTFVDLARRFNVGYEELVRANPGVDPWLPGEGRRIVLPTAFILPNAPREGVIINVAAMRLFYFPKPQAGEPQTIYTFPIGIGRVGWKTPEGTTKIVRKAKNPIWRPGAGVRAEHRENGEILPAVVPAGPDNPLGTRAMYLGWPSYLIHGTNKPAGVGLRSSHGCIRLFPEDVELLYELVKPGEKVTVVNQPFVFGWQGDVLHLQAFDVLEDDPRDWRNATKRLLSRNLADKIERRLRERREQVDWEAVQRLAHDPHGVPVPIAGIAATLDTVLAAAPRVRNALPRGSNWSGSDAAVAEAKP
ncbi:MAG: L,D-transpeptidase family protein [Steroidobacteraceae bacterium]|jgi:L,D-transpeptidase ErfK/SrfK